MFRGSGAMDLVTAALRPIATATGFPAELVPLAILRSLTGSGSLAFTTDVVKTAGPDSLLARTAATMYGSSETTFYVVAVYFGAVGIRKTRHAVPAALVRGYRRGRCCPRGVRMDVPVIHPLIRPAGAVVQRDGPAPPAFASASTSACQASSAARICRATSA
jgi:hypothetical protein